MIARIAALATLAVIAVIAYQFVRRGSGALKFTRRVGLDVQAFVGALTGK